MESFGSVSDAQLYGREDDCGFYDFQPLPALLEDEENVSLADILTLRDSCLLEEEIWAFCLECCLSLKDISHSSLFQMLCITPDTLAFNANGNVCFMEQLSDDPEGAFVPPEFDLTGNTFEAHIYSLGRSLQAAIDYVTEPETELELGQDLMALLEQMQQEDAEGRPDIKSIISLCEAKLMHTSSSRICRNLSAIGRRMLSIESIGPRQDYFGVTQKKQDDNIAAKQKEETCERNPADGSSSTEELPTDFSVSSSTEEIPLHCKQCVQNLDERKTSINKDRLLDNSRNKKNKADLEDLLHSKGGSLDGDVRTDNVPLTSESLFQEVTATSQGDLPALTTGATDKSSSAISKANRISSASELSVPEAETFASECRQEAASFQEFFFNSNAVQPENVQQTAMHSIQKVSVLLESSGGRKDASSLERGASLNSALVKNEKWKSMHSPDVEPIFHSCPNVEAQNITSAGNTQIVAELGSVTAAGQAYNELEKCTPNFFGVSQHKAVALHTSGNAETCGSQCLSPGQSAAFSNGTHSVSNSEDRKPEETSPNLWIKLHDLLSQSGKPLKDYELWSLCHECLSTLRTYIDFPAYLCLNSVTVDRNGAILFVTPEDTGSNISEFAAPELGTGGVMTEKACVYSVAAILWASAKCNIKENHPLMLPRKLKHHLLNMAKRNPGERLSLTEAQQICSEYLHSERMNSRKILSQLITMFQESRNVSLSANTSVKDYEDTVHAKDTAGLYLGFVPIKTKSRLTAIKGPVPCQYPVNNEPSNLPDAFTSPVTHFKPIIITQNIASTSTESSQKNATEKKHVKSIKRKIQQKIGAVPMNEIEKDANCGGTAVPYYSKWDSPSNRRIAESDSLEEYPKEKSSNDSFPSVGQTASVITLNEQREEQMKTALSSSFDNLTVSNSSQVNNFLLRQDPKTGVLTLVPVQVAVPDQLSGMQFQTATYDLLSNQQVVPFLATDAKLNANSPATATNSIMSNVWPRQNNRLSAKDLGAESPLSGKKITQELVKLNVEDKPLSESKDVSKSTIVSSECSPSILTFQIAGHPHVTDETSVDAKLISLRKVIQHIKEEFAFEGYLDNGVEDAAMGEYILALKGLSFGTFCGAVSEKFNDLYWDEKLLLNLYEAVNGKPPQPSPAYHAGLEIQNTTPTDQKTEDDEEEDSVLLQILKKAINKRNKSASHVETLASPVSVSPATEDVMRKSEILFGEISVEEEEDLNVDTEDLPQTIVSFDEMDLPDSIYLPQGIEESSPFKTKGKTSIRRTASLGSAHHCSPSSLEENDVTDLSKTLTMSEHQHPVSSSSKRKRRCSLGWRSAFFGPQIFDQEVQSYVGTLGRSKASDPSNMDSKIQEVEQHLMMEVKHYKKTQIFYQKLLHKERKNKGVNAKAMLSKLKGELEEMKIKVQFLETVKTYLEVLKAEEWGLELPLLSAVISASSRCEMETCKLLDSSQLMFQSVKEHEKANQIGQKIVQAGTTTGLLAYLYSSNAVLDGYIQQFLYTYRYFCTPEEVLQFIIDSLTSVSRTHLDTPLNTKIYNRSLYLVQTWIEDCYMIDFAFSTKLLVKLEDFLASKIIPVDNDREHLISMIQDAKQKEHGLEFFHCCSSSEEVKKMVNSNTVHTLHNNMSVNYSFRKSFRWKISKMGDVAVPYPKTKQYTLATALPRPNLNGFIADVPPSCIKMNENGPYLLAEWTAQHLAFQLTLLQQEMFQKCHAVHFLNSRVLGVKDKNIAIQMSAVSTAPPAGGTSLFVPLYKQDQYLLELLKYSDNISTWISAEIVTCDRPKVWKNLSSKVCEIMDELRAVEVFLKSDALCLMMGDRFRKLPTIPSSHLLSMHVQQLETGGFTLANGAYKWSKLRNISKVVSQIPAFQEQRYEFLPDLEMQTYLQHRIVHFCEADIPVLAAKNTVNFHKLPADKHSRKIQDTLRRMKATFQ
ncbi:kinase non-catalytic C-lobe domain-containing protein 1 isoform X2 [Protopterus annectens]|uniref:kinase non-catalytic C-lobe domain-containing protein 1 isoform X2 n=1 Tax=Protopterus annectens TaxID=7888 RepID=UPI001CF9F61A|nr:kinase non-catalytic C-lobe domain-containing protein 1 isoform X2 [Protopterus annectens]